MTTPSSIVYSLSLNVFIPAFFNSSTALTTLSCYESPKKGIVSHVFEHLIQNLKTYNGVEI